MRKVVVHTEELNKICQFELEKSLESINSARQILRNQSIPNQFKYCEDIRLIAKKLESYSQQCEEYRDRIKKCALGFEQLSNQIIKKVNAIEKVEIGKYINR